MIRFTTPTIPCSVPLDITDAEIIASIKQGATKVSKVVENATYNAQSGKTTFSFSLTQTESGGFAVGKAKIMANWIFPNSNRDGSAVGEILIEENLEDRVINYGDV